MATRSIMQIIGGDKWGDKRVLFAFGHKKRLSLIKTAPNTTF